MQDSEGPSPLVSILTNCVTIVHHISYKYYRIAIDSMVIGAGAMLSSYNTLLHAATNIATIAITVTITANISTSRD